MLRWNLSGVLLAAGCLVAATPLAPVPVRGAAHASLPSAPENSATDSGAILDRNLFDSGTSAPPTVEQANLGELRLSVALLGTFAATEPALSRATLYDRATGRTLVVGVGDEIEDQALVMRIERERVVLSEKGAPRELTLVAVVRGATPATRPSPDEDHAIPNLLRGQVQVLPKFKDDQMLGLEVRQIQAGSLFEQIGLENGDVITEFNGDPVDSQAKIATILREMFESAAYQVAGLRADGTEQVWDFVRE